MKIGLYDGDGHNFPSLPLMKISAWHKSKGDNVEWAIPFEHYDKVYVSRVFGDEYTTFQDFAFNADEIIYGGTGFAITVGADGKEHYEKTKDIDLPDEIEHIYPDYELYPELTKNRAYGFLTRGCPNNCEFCIVTKKEGRISHKVADLSEFWRGQKYIELMDANLLACRERNNLLLQLANCGAWVNFNQGLDARFITEETARLLKKCKISGVHFAFDFMQFEKQILNGLRIYKEIVGTREHDAVVYILTNFNTTMDENLYRINKVRELGYLPDVRVYMKSTAPQIVKDLQRWVNNRPIFRRTEWLDYVPRADGKSIRELYYQGETI